MSAPAELLARARTVYGDDPAASRILDELEVRLREPVRIAIAGMVKAGKSTLLNALIGEQIAPTDAGECTRTVIWYRCAGRAGSSSTSARSPPTTSNASKWGGRRMRCARTC
ncbi:MAG: GTP-binding protein [Microbacterium sp.]|nr:GTP-binding protein [Microbacterium sp.]